MDYIRMENNAILFENDGEVLRIEPWGKDSLRVRAAMMREIQDTDYALLPAEETEAVIQIKDGFTGSITNGRITACLEVCQWKKRCQISFYNQKGELLLKEAGHGGALNNHSRHFRPRLGGDYELTVTFQAREEEKLFGMGQYQQELLDIKNCVLELAHRNSQASVPFVLSDAGYGFLWHNPAVGKVVFGKNLTEWYAESTEQMDYWITAGDTPEKIDRYVKTIYNKTNEMDHLINELTFYSKIDTNRIPYTFSKLNVEDYFSDCAEEVGLELETRGIELVYANYVEDNVQVIADGEQIRRVIHNIISNAIKYMDKPKGIIQIRIKDVGDFIQVEIEDNGKGIAAKDLPSIFDRFYRTDVSRNSSKGGSGIGLSIVKKILEDHGGKVWATSRLGIGTIMYFVLRKYQEVPMK